MKIRIRTRFAAGVLAAIALTTGSLSLRAQPTNFMLYNFNTNQVNPDPGPGPYGTIWGNWFGGAFVSVAWDSTSDASNNPASGSMMLQINWPPGDQYVLNDGTFPPPNWGPFNIQATWTNLSFDMRYDVSSAIRTNTGGGNGSLGPGSLDFGYMRVGSRSGGNQDWYNYFAISATNGAGLPNTNWIHKDIDLRGVLSAFGDLSAGLVDILIGMDGNAYGNAGLVGPLTVWFDNIKFSGFIAPIPPPTLSIEKASPKALWLFGGSGLYGRSQVALVDTSATWIGGNFPVKYSFTILDNATSPGALQTGIQFIGGNPGDQSYQDYGANNVLWLRIVSGTGTNTACVADVSWKTNAPGSNPDQHNIALMITNPVLAGTWTLTFNSDTNGTLTAPGASPVPFSIALGDADAALAFGAPTQVRFGHENFGNTANGGVPHYWANILVTNTAGGISLFEDFTKEGTNRLDTTIWNLNTSDGVGVINLVPTNAPYWIKWTQPDNGFALVNGVSVLDSIQNWIAPANVTPISQGGRTWALITHESLPAGSQSYYALINRTNTQLQILLPGETNAPNTLTGKIGTPDPVSLSAGGTIDVRINAVDPTYHIVTTAPANMIALGCTDPLVTLPPPAALVNGTVTEQVIFGSTGSFTVTATNTSNLTIPVATSSPVTVGP